MTNGIIGGSEMSFAFSVKAKYCFFTLKNEKNGKCEMNFMLSVNAKFYFKHSLFKMLLHCDGCISKWLHCLVIMVEKFQMSFHSLLFICSLSKALALADLNYITKMTSSKLQFYLQKVMEPCSEVRLAIA